MQYPLGSSARQECDFAVTRSQEGIRQRSSRPGRLCHTKTNIDAELRESKTVRTQDAIFETSDAWRQKAEREGWTPTH
jgi:hypothetical protein